MVKSGIAWVCRKYAKGHGYLDSLEEAKLAKLGLWLDANPVAPWDWRKEKCAR